MPYKVSPTPSIEVEGIAVHVNNFFIKKSLPHRYGDVVRLKNLKIGGRNISKDSAAKELQISKNTLIKWYKLIDKESLSAESKTD
jgi:hypothetical protein